MMPRRSRRDAYSLIEVMTAVAIMIVGATGLVLMQGATTRGNIQAQETTVAVTVAQNWVERLKRESLAWTTVGWPAGAGTPNLANANNEPYAPVTITGAESGWADAFGFDTTVPTDARYFVRLVNHELHVQGGAADALRVDVTVYWFRSVYGAHNSAVANRAPAGFDPPSPGVVLGDPELASPLTNKVYASVVVKVGGP